MQYLDFLDLEDTTMVASTPNHGHRGFLLYHVNNQFSINLKQIGGDTRMIFISLIVHM